MTRPFPAFAARLVDLHSLIRAGNDEGVEGDAIRDQMDQLWRHLSPAEVEQVGQLSEDLYFIHDSPAESIQLNDDIWREINIQMSRENWMAAINAIRRHRAELPAVVFAFLAGLCWAEVGEWSIARAFFAEAYRRQPNVDRFTVCLLSAAVRTGPTKEDAELAKVVAASSNDAVVLLKAAEVIESASDRFHDQDVQDLKTAEKIAKKGIQLAEAVGLDDDMRPQVVRAYLGIALTNAILGNVAEAKSACDRALHLEPSNVDAFMVAGFLNAGESALQSHESRSGVSQRLQETSTPVLPRPSLLPAIVAAA